MSEMGSSFLTDYITSSQDVSDCRLISKDGKEFLAHKIILAARSEFFRDILTNISDTGHATIILPDHIDEEVDNILTEIISLGKELTDKILIGLLFMDQGDPKSQSKTILDVNNYNVKVENNHEDHVPGKDKLESCKNRIESNANKENENKNVEIPPDMEDQSNIENYLETKKSLYREATNSYLNGDFSSLYQVSKYYNLPYSTLYNTVCLGHGSFRGKGRKASLFSTEEEKEIAGNIVAKAKGGIELTWKVLKEMMETEIEKMMTLDPTRDTFRVSATKGSLIDRYFVKRFARRNNLTKYIVVHGRKNSDFECKECKKIFSFKNALTKHVKTIHK